MNNFPDLPRNYCDGRKSEKKLCSFILDNLIEDIYSNHTLNDDNWARVYDWIQNCLNDPAHKNPQIQINVDPEIACLCFMLLMFQSTSHPTIIEHQFLAANLSSNRNRLQIKEKKVKIKGDEPKKGGQPKAQNQPKSQPTKKAQENKKVVVNLADYPQPQYWDERIAVWDKVKKKLEKKAKHEEKPIKVILPDGSQKDGVAFKTSPLDVALSIAKGLADSVVVAKVNGSLFDLTRPLEGDCTLQLLKFDDPEAKKVFWHSSSHVMGQALERKFHCNLAIGPALKADKGGGFYYDMSPLKNEIRFQEDDYPIIEGIVSKIVEEQQPFERIELTKEEALEMFHNNKYKVELINEKVPDGESCTAYRCGPLIDLCKGPHLPSTGKIKAFGVWRNSSAYWKGDAANDSLQRIYGMSFPQPKDYKAWQAEQEAAKERDHRLQGKKQELFFFHPLSPGSCFFLPKGAKIYNKLVDFIRSEYRIRGFQEVMTPNMFNKDLWTTSGHWALYAEDMFTLQVDDTTFGLKPMNCPGHCLMFGHTSRSYKDLPIRYADFGVLHRNELAGALSGLTRVRRFCQDDAHIFCRKDQIKQEISGALNFLKDVYGVFGFTFLLNLSTRPEKFLGEIEVWDAAEKALQEELDNWAGVGKWNLKKGDGAFYGPKIDIQIFDVYKREHQCATIQLDFQLPKRFGLHFVKEDGSNEGVDSEPVIIHRAVLGSLERFMAILIESTNGKWPLWLSPHPVVIVPVNPKLNDYADKVKQQIFDAGIDVEVDKGPQTFGKKIAEARNLNANFILVIGEKESLSDSVNVRARGSDQEILTPLSEFISSCKKLIDEKK